ncbi:MAG: ABC transporter permease subunit [Fimbriiglobus sp.]
MSEPPFDPEKSSRRLVIWGTALLVLGIYFSRWWSLPLVLVGGGLLLFSCYSARDGFLLLGPVTHFEILRATRKRKIWLMRCLYTIAAAAILLGNVVVFADQLLWFNPGWFPPGALAAINERVTFWFAGAIAVVAMITTMNVMPGVVAEEREGKRWDILLTTDLRPREILVGKVVGRMLVVLEPLVTILPILALMPLWGGVPPELVLLFGGILFMQLMSLTAAACFYSVFSATTQDANGRTVGMLMLFMGLGTFTLILPLFGALAGFPASYGINIGITVLDVAQALMFGNPVYVVGDVIQKMNGGRGSLDDLLAAKFGAYAAFQIFVTVAFGGLACLRLRHAKVWATKGKGKHQKKVDFVESTPTATPKNPLYAKLAPNRPPVWDWSLTWWQIYAGFANIETMRYGKSALRQYVKTFLISLAILAALLIGDPYIPYIGGQMRPVLKGALPLFFLGPVVVGIFSTMFRGSATIAQERSQDTMLMLRTTPLSAEEIVGQKWLGVYIEMRHIIFLGAMVGLAGTALRLVHPLSVLLTLLFAIPALALTTSIGIWFSARALTPAKAGRNLALTVFLGGYLAMIPIGLFIGLLEKQGIDIEPMLAVLPVPGISSGFAAYLEFIADEKMKNDLWKGIYCFLGIPVQLGMAYGLYRWACYRFSRENLG